MVDHTNYLYIAIRAALDAGHEIMKVYVDSEKDGLIIEKKTDNSPLTKADQAAHDLIVKALSVTSLPILSEEGTEIPYKERASWDLFWMVDPVDGTKEFIKRNGEFTVNIALIKDRTPVLGVIYVPVRKELYFASDIEGAFKAEGVDYDEQPSYKKLCETAKHLPLRLLHQGIVVVSSRSHKTEQCINFIENLKKQGKPVTEINSGSSLKICMVAEGTADIYPRFAPSMEWDTAAGHAIARAAGCEIFHVDEKTPLVYNKENLLNPWLIVKSTSASF